MSRTLALLVLLSATAGAAETVSLEQAVNLTLAHSADLRALEARVEQARAEATLADGFRPSASVATTPGYATGLPTAVLGQVPAIGTVEAHRLFYDIESQVDRIGSAARVDAAIAQLAARRREIALETAELYAAAGADTLLVASARRRLAAYQKILETTEALRQEQRARDLDLDRARLQIARAEHRLEGSTTRLELDRLKLSRLAGEAIEILLVADAAAPLPVDSLTAAESRDPELTSLETRIEKLDQHELFRADVSSRRSRHSSNTRGCSTPSDAITTISNRMISASAPRSCFPSGPAGIVRPRVQGWPLRSMSSRRNVTPDDRRSRLESARERPTS